MPDPDPCPDLRARIRALQLQRRSIESKLLQPQTLCPGSLIERFLRVGGRVRTRPAYYLSRSHQGRSKLAYVPKAEIGAVQQQCGAYQAFQQNWRAWRQLTGSLEQCWKQLQQAQSR